MSAEVGGLHFFAHRCAVAPVYRWPQYLDCLRAFSRVSGGVRAGRVPDAKYGNDSGAIGVAGAFSGCKDQCSAFPGLLQDSRENRVEERGPAGAFGTVWHCLVVCFLLCCFPNETGSYSSPYLSE